MIKLIIFDFGGTIGCDSNDWNNTFKKIPLLTGLSPSELNEIFDDHWQKIKTGKESFKLFWKDVTNKSKIKVDSRKLIKTYNKAISVKKGVLDLAKRLKKKFKLVILMNAGDEDGKAKAILLKGIFSKVYNSAQMGVAKPDPKAFKTVLESQKVKPSEALFIDNQPNFISVAESLGINSIHFKDINSLKKDLANFLAY